MFKIKPQINFCGFFVWWILNFYINLSKLNDMITTETLNGETYIYLNGELIHKTRNDNSESGVTFDVMAYRKGDSLKSITEEDYQKRIMLNFFIENESNKY